ncbi:hypothetical protein [Nocardia pseudovaccinii]|uniref:hypothetical protein n=1 Tax=Nocardia pseudovaccinii TaxID=189540 RepID=UPI0007A53DF3|nr:hypothetical protein [Nocardia pseudovaccinii]
MTAAAVALVSGSPKSRRAVLERAARWVGATGTVHVVCDGISPSMLFGSIALSGLFVDAVGLEDADFTSTARILSRHGCGWNWWWGPVGAHAVAVRRAAALGSVMVLPTRSLMFQVRVAVRLPDAHRDLAEGKGRAG